MVTNKPIAVVSATKQMSVAHITVKTVYSLVEAGGGSVCI